MCVQVDQVSQSLNDKQMVNLMPRHQSLDLKACTAELMPPPPPPPPRGFNHFSGEIFFWDVMLVDREIGRSNRS
jgi:hypothetical protein